MLVAEHMTRLLSHMPELHPAKVGAMWDDGDKAVTPLLMSALRQLSCAGSTSELLMELEWWSPPVLQWH